MQETLFKFDPNLSDAPLARGRYEATITDAQHRVSKAGNEMLELTVHVVGPYGNVILRDWLVSTPRTKWKIRQFCKGVGLDYHRGEISPEMVRGKDVTIEVGVEEDREGRDRNVITDYVEKAAGQASGQDGGNGKNGHNNGNGRAERQAKPGAILGQVIEDGEEIPF